MKTHLLEYQDGSTTLEAFIARPQSDQPKPTVIICHAWAGRSDFENNKAEQLAQLGYVGFALDMYGKGQLGTSIEENSQLMTPLMEDRALLKRRVMLALETANALPFVDSDNIAVMGFCFGGLCALDLARTGVAIKGAVSFHGLFEPPPVTEPIQAKILALHGHLDPMAPPDSVSRFQDEMSEADADWQTHVYGTAYHAFTNPEANDSNMGAIYNEAAANRSWVTLRNFLTEIFQ